MKKTHKQSIIFIILSALLFLISFYEAYRITSIIDYDVVEILFTYETFILEVFIILSVLYLIILIIYNDQYDQLHFTIKRSYLIINLTIAMFGYLLGLNLEYILGNKEAFSYVPFMNFWLFILLLIFIILIDVSLLYKTVNIRKNTRWIDFMQLILTIIFAILFSILLTDSTSVMGVFD